MNSLMCILYTDPQLITDVITLLRTTAAPKNFCITPWWVFVFDLGISTSKDRVSTPGKSGNLLEDQEKSGKFDIFWKKSGKSKGKKFYPCVFLTFKKTICIQKYVQLNCIWQSVVYMMFLFASSIKMIWYCQSFLF